MSHTNKTLFAQAPIYPPVPSDFTWMNQGSATLDTSLGSMYIEHPAESGFHVHGMDAPIPAPIVVGPDSWSLTALISPNWYMANNFLSGIYIRDSVSGKMVCMFFMIAIGSGYETGCVQAVDKFSDPDTVDGQYAIRNGPIWPQTWVRYLDNGMGRFWQFGNDGKRFTTFDTVGNIDYITPDRIGFLVAPQNAAPSFPAGTSLLSWKFDY